MREGGWGGGGGYSGIRRPKTLDTLEVDRAPRHITCQEIRYRRLKF